MRREDNRDFYYFPGDKYATLRYFSTVQRTRWSLQNYQRRYNRARSVVRIILYFYVPLLRIAQPNGPAGAAPFRRFAGRELHLWNVCHFIRVIIPAINYEAPGNSHWQIVHRDKVYALIKARAVWSRDSARSFQSRSNRSLFRPVPRWSRMNPCVM